MLGQAIKRWLSAGLMATTLSLVMLPALPGFAQDESGRKLKNRVNPVYPDLARKMNVSGTVKVQVEIAADGSVKNTKVIGGHPLLIDAALDALKKWKYVPGPEETTTVEFHFNSAQ